MKSYLSLIPISAKVHQRQNRMTLLCIVISVLLVTAVFSMADMMIRTETGFMQEKHGSWHMQSEAISRDIGDEIRQRSDVAALGFSEAFNKDANEPFYIGEKKAALYGSDEIYITRLANALEEGAYPKNSGEVMLSSNAKIALNAELGDSVTLHTPAGDADYIISGFGSDDKSYYQGQTFLIGVYMTSGAYEALMKENGIDSNPVCYIQFQDAAKASDAIGELREQYGLAENSFSENLAVMGLAGSSDSEAMKNLYGIAAVLFVLVMLAGILMISGSMNSNVAQRTQFFGLMRCLGASRSQIMRFVRLEALNWCKTAVPAGMVLGTLISWGICALLRYGIGGEFSTMPVFAFSPVGLICGAAVGIITVLFAAQSPARHAAEVSPVTAISGNLETTAFPGRGRKRSFGKIQWQLGVHHATGAKKNWFLMTTSFALSIVMLLCFSVGMDFASALLPSLRSWQPDLSLCGYDNALILDRQLTDDIKAMEGVEQVYGVSYLEGIPASSPQSQIDHINLVSYDTYMLECAEESLSIGAISGVEGDSNKVLTIYNKNNPLQVGDTLRFGGEELEVAGALSDGLFADDLIVICSEKTFDRLMGEQKYNLIGVQLNEAATEQTVKEISDMATKDIIFSDARESNRQNAATFWATRIVGYGFLLIIAMITMFNIINSISMSVSARIKQYGAMRAVGMDGRQLTAMISAEALTYGFSGLIVGCGIGLPLSRLLYTVLITRYFGLPWTLPVGLLSIIALFVFAAAVIAVYAPAKRIRHMAIIDTINEL